MTELEHDTIIFAKLGEINDRIWKIIEDVQDFTGETDNKQIRKLVDLSGHLHVDIMRPLYKKHPEFKES